MNMAPRCLCAALCMVLCCTATSAAVAGGPKQLHLALGENPTVVTVTFVSSVSYRNSSCSIRHRNSTKSIRSYVGKSRLYSNQGWSGRIHSVRMDELPESTAMSYSCDGETWHGFQTPPPVGHLPITIAAVADLGENCDKEGCGNATIASLAADTTYSMLLHAGDIAYTGGDETIWDHFMTEIEPIASERPYMVCVGNHEHFNNFTGYKVRFTMPGAAHDNSNLWYSFDYGGVHFLTFSTEHHLDMQLPFIKQDLEAASANRDKVPWIVVFAHKPLYCSTNDYYDCNINSIRLRRELEPLFQHHKVDLFLGGHLHNYERTWPVMQNVTVAKSYTNPQATVHAVIGNAGDSEGLTDKWESCPDWSVIRQASLGYAKLFFESRTKLKFDLVESTNGSLLDTFTIERSVPEAPVLLSVYT
ncbi:Acp7 [Symbiodinium sp. CCMP2592]|nr:Acp7 [Symbiodinium sp. CCMP2592]